jgi:hypothetical protein
MFGWILKTDWDIRTVMRWYRRRAALLRMRQSWKQDIV